MIRKRVIPVLLLQNNGVVKTVNFKKAKYIGDPINTVKIFNDKEVDEIIILDIDATKKKKEIDYALLKDIVSESFMPLCYGGGISSIDQIRKIINCGIEKISINSKAIENFSFVNEAAKHYGSSTIIVSIDVKKDFFGNYRVYSNQGQIKTKYKALEFAKIAEEQGAGELLINSISNDGLMTGYDYDLIESVANAAQIPVIACGGAGSLQHLQQAFDKNASAAAAGSMFIYKGPHKAVLINYPTFAELTTIFTKNER
jgi:cyclase